MKLHEVENQAFLIYQKCFPFVLLISKHGQYSKLQNKANKHIWFQPWHWFHQMHQIPAKGHLTIWKGCAHICAIVAFSPSTL